MFTNKYPYTDFHELNADWLLKNVAPLPKEFNDLKSAVKTELDDIESELDNVESELDNVESELDNKVDKIPGKGLSTNDFTDADKTKLDGIEAGAQVNVQSDWDEDNASSDAYILNKPYVPAPIIDTASGSVASFPDGAPAPVISLSVDINAVQSGSGTPSPSNIRPISGWDAVNVTDCGKNFIQINASGSSSVSGGTFTRDQDAGTITCTGTITRTSNTIATVVSQKNYPSGTYIFSQGGTHANLSARLFDVTANAYLSASTDAETTVTIDETHLIAVRIYIPTGTYNANGVVFKPMLRIGGDSSFEPYTGTTTTISLGSTIYGGTLEVTSGVLTVTHGYIASYNGETLPGTWISDRDVYAAGTTPTTGAEVVYELATPTTVTLTPTQVQTVLGENNLWADSGSVSVVYRADTETKIAETSWNHIGELSNSGSSITFNVPVGASGLLVIDDFVSATDSHNLYIHPFFRESWGISVGACPFGASTVYSFTRTTSTVTVTLTVANRKLRIASIGTNKLTAQNYIY